MEMSDKRGIFIEKDRFHITIVIYPKGFQDFFGYCYFFFSKKENFFDGNMADFKRLVGDEYIAALKGYQHPKNTSIEYFDSFAGVLAYDTYEKVAFYINRMSKHKDFVKYIKQLIGSSTALFGRY